MFQLGSLGEILIIAVAALVLIGPKELPELMRSLGRLREKWRRLSSGIRQNLDVYLDEGAADEYAQQIRKEVESKSDE